MGVIGFPLTPQQAEQMRSLCEQAPYGKGEKTIVDTSVRRVWQMFPDKFVLKNRAWEQFLSSITKSVKEDLGLEDQQLEPQLYNLLLYEPGSFFLPHRDGEKVNGMVATLVIILPSAFKGGELIVRHQDCERRIDFSADENYEFKSHFTAFYADCEHEVLPLMEGFRVCLVYNLVLSKTNRKIGVPSSSEDIEQVTSLLKDCATRCETVPQKIVVRLDHQYTKNGLTWDALKGLDRARAHILKQAAMKAGWVAQIAELTYWEQGFGSECGRGRNRWYEEDEDDDEDDDSTGSRYEMYDVHESGLTAKITTSDNSGQMALGELQVDDDEVVSNVELTNVRPKEEFEGYMGNYGETLDRWYRHASIALWPMEHHFDILCELGTESAIVELSRSLQILDTEQPDPLAKATCIALARQIIDRWQSGALSRIGPGTIVDAAEAPDDDENNPVDEDEDEDEDDSDYDNDDEENPEEGDEDSDEDENIDGDYDNEEDDDGDGDSEETDDGDALDNPATPGQPSQTDTAEVPFLSCLQVLNDRVLTREFLSKVLPSDDTLDLTISFLHYCGDNGLAYFSEAFRHIYRRTTLDTLERNVRLFHLICSPELQSKREFAELAADLFVDLMAAMKQVDKQTDDWRSRKIDRLKLLTQLIKMLITMKKFDELAALLSYSVSARQHYSPRTLALLQCQLADWLLQNSMHECAISTWLDASINFLKVETTCEPQAPKDLRRTASIPCRCEDCLQLVEFLNSTVQSVCRFKVRQDRRSHLHQIIDSNELDVYHVTERKGSPQTLVCTKNVNSYERSARQYREDHETLAAIQALRAQLTHRWQ